MSEKFWHLDSAESTNRLAEWAHGEVEIEDPLICPVNPEHQRAGKRLTNLSIVLRGSKVEDFVWTWYNECLIQDHVLQIFREYGLTGFEVNPVKARFRKRSIGAPPKLWELVVTGWGGIAPPESGIKLIEYCPACGKRRYSCFTNSDGLIKESQWDGSDFFIVWPLPGYIFISDRVAQIIRDEKLRGVRLIQLNELACKADSLEPSRLSIWMPEKRAKELSALHGID